MGEQRVREQQDAPAEEQGAVRRWRRAQLLALGFVPRDAEALSRAPVDLGQVRSLVAAGCPLETVRRIVL